MIEFDQHIAGLDHLTILKMDGRDHV